MEKTTTSNSLPGVVQRAVMFNASDGVQLHGMWFLPSADLGPPRAAIVISCGGGVPARVYRGLAQHLATCNAAVLTFDYRGIGASRQGSLRGMSSGVETWGTSDLDAALTLARNTFPNAPLEAIAHSVGALLLGAARESRRLSRIVFLGPHTGFWRDYARRWRLPLYLTWHVLMPVATKIFGYFPGKALRLGEDLPPQVAMDWANRRQPELMRGPSESQRLFAVLERYAEVRAPTLVLSASDDAFAPPLAAKRLLALYPNARVTLEVLTPASFNCRRLGHFGYFHPPARQHVWQLVAEWLLSPGPRSLI
jgi:predicted alpha/beta hydrolase